MAKEHQVLPGYFLGLREMQEFFQTSDISKSQALKSGMWDIVNNVQT